MEVLSSTKMEKMLYYVHFSIPADNADSNEYVTLVKVKADLLVLEHICFDLLFQVSCH